MQVEKSLGKAKETEGISQKITSKASAIHSPETLAITPRGKVICR